MGWKGIGNPQPRGMGHAKTQKAIIRAATAKRVTPKDAPKHVVQGTRTVRK